MAVLQKMREKFGVLISVLIALSLLYFIAPMDDLMTLFGKPDNVGEIAGKSVSYEDFQAEVSNFETINEIVTGSSLKSEQQQEQIRNSAWQSFIDKYMFLENAKAAGLNVGEAEMVALTTGDQVSPIIAQNYAFCDENGQFNADAVVNFVQNVDNDATGRLRTYWNYLQNTIYTQQFYKKYGALFTASETLSPLMLEAALNENNTTTDIEYVSVPFGFTKDSTITVSSSEIRSYYNAHKDFYKQNASRDIEYVLYEVVPSASDIAAVSDSFTSSYDEFAETENVKNFLLKNSDRQYSEYWYKDGELSTVNREVNDFVFGGKGNVSPVFQEGNTFFAARIMKSAKIADSVYVKHILFNGNDAESKAEEVLAQLKKNTRKFSALAAENSVDQNSAADGEIGNIGWMTQTYMIPGFESTIEAEVGKPYIVKTQYGRHIVMVSKKSKLIDKKQVAVYEKTTLASKETFNSFYAEANKFATLASGKYSNYKAAVDSLGLFSHVMNNVLESNDNYGSIDNAKEITRWVYDNKAGKVSGIITVNNNYFFVVTLKNIHKEGYAPVEEVSAGINNILYAKKLGEKKYEEVKAKVEGMTDLNAVAEAFSSSVETKTDVAFGAMMTQGIDPALVGAASAADEGKLCGPVKGTYAVYMFKVTGRRTGTFYTEEDARNTAAQKSQYASQMIVPVMADGEVTDNRARYF